MHSSPLATLPDPNARSLASGAPAVRSGEKLSSIWSVILRAQGDGREAREALGRLIQRYDGLVVLTIRSLRVPPGYNAEDLKQDFFLGLVRKGDVHKLDPARGHFRNWLHKAVRNFVKNAWDRYYAGVRGESITRAMSFDVQHPDDPEQLFMRRYAESTVQCALELLGERERDQALFRRWMRFLPGPQLDPCALEREAEALNMSANHVAVRLHHLRKRFRSTLRELVADTLDVDPACPEGSRAIDAELRHLYRAMVELPLREVVLEDP